MSEKSGVPENTLRYWAKLGYVTSSRINTTLMLDEESLRKCIEIHKKLGVNAEYLSKLVEEKVKERDFILSEFDDTMYVLKTQQICAPLFKILIGELAQLVIDPARRDIFYAISTGEPIEMVARRHRMTYDKTVLTYTTLLKGMEHRKGIFASLRKLVVDYRLEEGGATLFSKEDFRVGSSGNPSGLLEREIGEIAGLRAYRALKSVDILTVGQLLKFVSVEGWDGLLKIRHLGRVSQTKLFQKLSEIGVKFPEGIQERVSNFSHTG